MPFLLYFLRSSILGQTKISQKLSICLDTKIKMPSGVEPGTMPTCSITALVWLRRDLRLFDHAALHHALRHSAQVICVFIFDTAILNGLPRADRRVAFIHASLQQIKRELNRWGSDLIVRHGQASTLIPQLADTLGADAVYANRDTEPAALTRDELVANQLHSRGKTLHLFKDQVIFERDELVTQSGAMYQVFTPYRRAWLAKLTDEQVTSYPIRPYTTHIAQFKKMTPETLPSLEELGFEAIDITQLKPGMDGGEALFTDFCQRIDRYHETRDFPAVKGVSYLSVHLRFGTVSIRELVRNAIERGGAGPEAWVSELIWREFYQQLLWHRPELATHTFKPAYDALPFPNNRTWFDAWCAGQTGFPIVDAGMRQLNQTGFMHNRLRMITASFLVKDLLIDWRWGERYFAEKLNDFDLASNNGGWQWAASTGCDAQPYFRIFNPTTQSQRFDPEGKFIRRYCPELASLDNKKIHAPDVALVDYPAPIVDHATQRVLALQLFGR
jgi:deoxyribodipyrimidine photo-lyase